MSASIEKTFQTYVKQNHPEIWDYFIRKFHSKKNDITQKLTNIIICPEVPVKMGEFKVELTITGVLVIETDTDVQAVHKFPDGKIRMVPKHS